MSLLDSAIALLAILFTVVLFAGAAHGITMLFGSDPDAWLGSDDPGDFDE